MNTLGRTNKLTDQNLMDYAWRLGYQLSPEDCDEIRITAYSGETVAHAVKDFLSAYEVPGRWYV
jgi:hypothetical protein